MNARRDAATLVHLLTAAGRTVAVAESLTGGALTDAFVTVPGASRCLRGGVVAYATDLKVSLLGVDGASLGAHGAVHPDVAREMAAGVRRLLDADYGIATTGVAGPDDQDGHRPGTFHVAVEGPAGGGVVSARPASAALSRAEVRGAACDAALALLLSQVSRDLAPSADSAMVDPGSAAGTGTVPAAGTERAAGALEQT